MGEARVAVDAASLTTHGVCVGMTGSGKTGLCVGLLEEVAGAGIPIVAIDPKGDLTNLALIEPEAGRAEAWRAGQAQWGIGPDEVRRWAGKVAVRVWTPGSDAGLGVNVLAALRRPTGELDDETRRELVLGSVSALLGLVGETADPVRSPAHIVLSRILEEAWARGEDPDLEALLAALVDPPFAKVGIFPTDRFFPPDDRFALAMRLNALIASPAFAAWATGAALDVPALLAPVDGRTPVNVFTLSHLSEPERHFFVGLLLDRIAAWARGLPGTNELRALVFFDEVWGYLPPHPKDPPAKRPILALMKQARAVGVGTVLATQNPVDLDYKALSNAGTWFVGRLQTRNDRDRVAEGLTASGMDRSDAE
ncbi:MAG: ATP-binding protein, partial [Myxococcota bacterium]